MSRQQLPQIKLLILAFLLSCAIHLVASQRLYAAGSFKGVTPISRSNFACYDHSQKAWRRNKSVNTVVSPMAMISETEAYYMGGNQLFYLDRDVRIPVNGKNGIFYNQAKYNETITNAFIDKILVNAARTTLWIIGRFNNVGTTFVSSILVSPSPATGIVAFDISKDKINPPMLPAIPSSAAYNFTSISEVFTQDKSLVLNIYETPSNRRRLFRLTADSWTPISSSTQDAGSATYKQTPDEAVWAYNTYDLLSSPLPNSQNPTIGRLATDSSTFTAILTNYQYSDSNVYSVTFDSDKWAPTNSKDVYFIHASVNLTGNTNDNKMAKDRLMQFLYKVSGENGQVSIVSPTARLVKLSASFDEIRNVVGDMVYDAATQNIMIEGAFDHVVYGDLQNTYPTPTTQVMVEDKTFYRAVAITQDRAMLDVTKKTFIPFLGGNGPYSGSSLVSISNYVNIPSTNFTCFLQSGNLVGYNVFSPFIVSYSSNGWAPVDGISGLIDSNIIKNNAPAIYAIERINGAFSTDVFIGGWFKSINNQTFNSIVKYSIVNNAPKLDPLDNGVLIYDVVPEGSNTFNDYARYYNVTPGVVSQLAYDPSTKNLFVYGYFFQAGKNVVATNLACWNDGTKTWRDVASGVTGGITKMIIYNGYLVVAGTITRAGNLPVTGIAMYNIANNTWEPMGQGISGFADMVVYQNTLVVSGNAAGRRTTIGSPSINAWNTNSRTWYPLNILSVSESSLCYSPTDSPTCSLSGTPVFHLANNKLFAYISNTLYYFNGNSFEKVSTTSGIVAVRGGLEDNTRITVVTNSGKTTVFSEPASVFSSTYYNFDRTEDNLADGAVQLFVGSASQAQLSSFFLIALALVFTVFLF